MVKSRSDHISCLGTVDLNAIPYLKNDVITSMELVKGSLAEASLPWHAYAAGAFCSYSMQLDEQLDKFGVSIDDD